MNTLERELRATETQSAASPKNSNAAEELRDEAISALAQTWQVDTSDIDVTDAVTAAIVQSLPVPQTKPLEEDERILAPIGASAAAMEERLQKVESAKFALHQSSRDFAWLQLVGEILEQQAQENEANASRSSSLSEVPEEFGVYFEYERAVNPRQDDIFPTLAAEQERRVLDADAEGKNWARIVLVNANLSQVYRIAQQFVDSGIDSKHILAAGMQALVQAAGNASSNTAMSFATRATVEIWKAMHQAAGQGDIDGSEGISGQEEQPLPQRIETVSNALNQQAYQAQHFDSEWKRFVARTVERQLRKRVANIWDASYRPSDAPQEFALYGDASRAWESDGKDIYPLLTAEQEQQLFQAKEQGEAWARDVLVTANLYFIPYATSQHLETDAEPEQVFTAGLTGLEEAIDSFDFRANHLLFSHAMYLIQKAVRDAQEAGEIKSYPRNIVKEEPLGALRQRAKPAQTEQELGTDSERQPPAPPYPPTAVGAPAPAPEPEGELRRLLYATVSDLRVVREELSMLRAEVFELRQERTQHMHTPSVPPRPSTARLFPFAPPERAARREP